MRYGNPLDDLGACFLSELHRILDTNLTNVLANSNVFVNILNSISLLM